MQCFNNTGQSCNAPTRMLVERSIYERVVAEAAQIAEGVEVESAHKPGAHIGPLASLAQFQKVQEMIQIGIDEERAWSPVAWAVRMGVPLAISPDQRCSQTSTTG